MHVILLHPYHENTGRVNVLAKSVVYEEDHYTQAREERGRWWIHPGFETHGQSQLKSGTESTSGSTKWWLAPQNLFKKSVIYCFSEYEKRLDLYKERTWTCQCTGHINLSHEQAWKSEQEKMDLLKKQFPEYFEKPVLEIVHHSEYSYFLLLVTYLCVQWNCVLCSCIRKGYCFVPLSDTTILDDLVDQTWTRLQQILAVREPVALKVKSGGKE